MLRRFLPFTTLPPRILFYQTFAGDEQAQRDCRESASRAHAGLPGRVAYLPARACYAMSGTQSRKHTLSAYTRAMLCLVLTWRKVLPGPSGDAIQWR
eukprot:3880082-Rhodomonas_salina.1